jgi:hypothetical protein
MILSQKSATFRDHAQQPKWIGTVSEMVPPDGVGGKGLARCTMPTASESSAELPELPARRAPPTPPLPVIEKDTVAVPLPLAPAGQCLTLFNRAETIDCHDDVDMVGAPDCV